MSRFIAEPSGTTDSDVLRGLGPAYTQWIWILAHKLVSILSILIRVEEDHLGIVTPRTSSCILRRARERYGPMLQSYDAYGIGYFTSSLAPTRAESTSPAAFCSAVHHSKHSFFSAAVHVQDSILLHFTPPSRPTTSTSCALSHTVLLSCILRAERLAHAG